MPPLYDFKCEACQKTFEESISIGAKVPPCPACGSDARVAKQVTSFRVGGRGDLRESTMHGCHDATPATPATKKKPGGGHSHGPGCGH